MKILTPIVLLFIAANLYAQTFLQETVMVPMRDGVQLATDVYRMNDNLSHPVILYRTPYNKDTDGFDDDTIKLLNVLGYIYIAQDCRGRFHSEGVDSVFLNDGWGKLQDGYDTIDWIVGQSWCNGKVAQLGGSATGITTLRAAAALHPNLACAAVLVAPSDFYSQVVYPGGEFRKSLVENWVHSQGSDYMIDYFQQFPYYNALWEEMNLHTRTAMMTVPILHIGGWYDCFSEGTIQAFRDLQQQPNAGPQKLVMGPWVHGEPTSKPVGELQYPDAGFDWEGLLLNWLHFWLRGAPNGVLESPDVTYYLMGDPQRTDEMGCEWLEADQWPPQNSASQSFYLTPDGGLSAAPPSDESRFDYRFDPLNPAPTVGGANLTIAVGPYDQRAVGSRRDILSFTGEVLSAPVRVEGFVRGKLFISSNRPDTDFTLKLIDVYPDGREMLVTDGIRRARFRDGYTEDKVKFLNPDEIVSIDIELPPTAIVFNSGHRIKVQISSANFPRYEVNPNTGAAPNDRTGAQIAENTVYVGGDQASHVLLPIVPTGTSVARRTASPSDFHLLDNYPNPFNAATVIHYSLPTAAHVVVEIFNSRGQRVRILANERQNAGSHRLVWNGAFDSGEAAPSGVYLYRLRAGDFTASKKMLLVR